MQIGDPVDGTDFPGLGAQSWRTPSGLVVGLSRSRVIPWSTVRRVAAGRNRRLGSATLEIDLEDDELLLFSRIELGTDPTDVSAALSRWFADRSTAP
jgi:hypothetical protein